MIIMIVVKMEVAKCSLSRQGGRGSKRLGNPALDSVRCFLPMQGIVVVNCSLAGPPSMRCYIEIPYKKCLCPVQPPI